MLPPAVDHTPQSNQEGQQTEDNKDDDWNCNGYDGVLSGSPRLSWKGDGGRGGREGGRRGRGKEGGRGERRGDRNFRHNNNIIKQKKYNAHTVDR